MSSDNKAFTKENLDVCFRQLAKEFRRLNGTAVPAEIILIGGAAVLANYGFRDMTYDVDAIIRASSSMKEAINRVGDTLGLPNGWLNSDFIHTSSYSPKLVQFSRYYRTYANVLTIRTVSGEYLVAMKLMSGRKYKNDISDIVGILREEKEGGTPITFGQIDKAVCDLYGDWERMPQNSSNLIQEILRNDNFDELYTRYRRTEKQTKSELIDFVADNPRALHEDNIDEVIAALRRKKSREDLER